MKKKIFVRKDTWKFSRFGKGRKKKRTWRRPRGMHGKIRLKIRGHPSQPSVGYKNVANVRGKIQGLNPKTIYNEQELTNLGKNDIAIIGNVGLKKKILLVEKAKSLGIKIANLNADEFLTKFKIKGKK